MDKTYFWLLLCMYVLYIVLWNVEKIRERRVLACEYCKFKYLNYYIDRKLFWTKKIVELTIFLALIIAILSAK